MELKLRNVCWLVLSCCLMPPSLLATETYSDAKECQVTVSIHLDRVFTGCDWQGNNCQPPVIKNFNFAAVQQPEGCSPGLPKQQVVDFPTCSNNSSSVPCKAANNCIGGIPKPQLSEQSFNGQDVFEQNHCLHIETELGLPNTQNLPTPTLCYIHERFERDPPNMPSQGLTVQFQVATSDDDFAFGLRGSYDFSNRWSLDATITHSDDGDTVFMVAPMFYPWRGDRASSFLRLGMGIADLQPSLRFSDGAVVIDAGIPAIQAPVIELEKERSLAAEFTLGLDYYLSKNFFIRPEIGARWIEETDEFETLGMLGFGWRCGMP